MPSFEAYHHESHERPAGEQPRRAHRAPLGRLARLARRTWLVWAVPLVAALGLWLIMDRLAAHQDRERPAGYSVW